MSGYNLWRYDRNQTCDLFLDGEPCVVKSSEYLANDFLLESMMEYGFWDRLSDVEPELGREDVAVDPMVLNRVWAFKELAGCGHVSEVDKILTDGRLMALAGFNLEVIRDKALAQEGQPVVSRRTLYRHAERIPRGESQQMLLDTTAMLRSKKWLRGGVYAADCYDIPVSGKKMEGIYENTDQKEKRGYKLLVISNVSKHREFAVAAALGGICQDERVLLEAALRSLEAVCPPHQMIKLLLLDRGFWKAQLMWHLANKWKLPFLTLAKENLDLTQEVLLQACGEDKPLKQSQRNALAQMEAEEAKKQWKELTCKVIREVEQAGKVPWETMWRKSGHTGKRYQYRLHGLEGVYLDGYSEDGKSAGSVNCLLAYRGKEFGNPGKQVIYVTSQPVKGRERVIVDQYADRWSIENQMMKWLSEHDGRKMNGWTLNAVQYRLFLLLLLRNAMTVVHWKRPKDAGRMKRLLAQRKRRSYLEGHGAVIYMNRGVFGTFFTDEAVDMGETRGVRKTVKKIKETIKNNPELPGITDRGQLLATLEELLKEE